MLLGLALACQGEGTGLGPRPTLAQGEFLFLTCPSPGAFMQADWMCNTGGIFLHEASKCLPACSPTPRTGAFPLTGNFTSGINTLSPHFSTPTLSRPSPGARVLRHSVVKPTPETCLRGPFPPSNQEKGEEKKYSET